MDTSKLKAITVDSIQVSADKGVTLIEVLREAAILALTEKVKVVVAHNDRPYTIMPGSLIGYITERNHSTSSQVPS